MGPLISLKFGKAGLVAGSASPVQSGETRTGNAGSGKAGLAHRRERLLPESISQGGVKIPAKVSIAF